MNKALTFRLYGWFGFAFALICLAATSFLLVFVLARTQFYVLLSEIAWELQGVTAPGEEKLRSAVVWPCEDSKTLVNIILNERIYASMELNELHDEVGSLSPLFQQDIWTELKHDSAFRGTGENRVRGGSFYRSTKLFGFLPVLWLLPWMVWFARTESQGKSHMLGWVFVKRWLLDP